MACYAGDCAKRGQVGTLEIAHRMDIGQGGMLEILQVVDRVVRLRLHNAQRWTGWCTIDFTEVGQSGTLEIVQRSGRLVR
jgi:hypothetical protein